MDHYINQNNVNTNVFALKGVPHFLPLLNSCLFVGLFGVCHEIKRMCFF